VGYFGVDSSVNMFSAFTSPKCIILAKLCKSTSTKSLILSFYLKFNYVMHTILQF